MCRRLVFTFLVLIVLVREESNASPIRIFRKLMEAESPGGQPMQSPAPSNGSDSSGLAPGNSDGESPGNHDSTKVKLIGVITDERCKISSSVKCHDVEKNMTACLVYAKSGGPHEPFLIVQNDGETSLEIHMTTFPHNITYEDMELHKHLAMKINISTTVGRSQWIALNAGDGDCEIQLESPTSEDNTNHQTIPFSNNSYYTLSMPSGAYIVVVVLIVVVVAGGAWAFVKVRGRERHLDGIPYQELEMGHHHPESSLSAVNVETVEGWDKDWDDDWDEDKAVRTPGKKKHPQANAFAASTASSDGWEHDEDGD